MKTAQEYLHTVEKALGLHDVNDADSTLLNDYIVRVYFDDCLQTDRVEDLKKKIVSCCDGTQCQCEIEQFNCHIVDVIKR